MALRFKCHECGQLHRVPDSMGGRSIFCFSCGKPVFASTKNWVPDDASVDQAAGEIVVMGPLQPAKPQEPASLEAQGLELVEDPDDAPLKMADDDDKLPVYRDEAPPPKAAPVTPRESNPPAGKSNKPVPVVHNPRKTSELAATPRARSATTATNGAAALRAALSAPAKRPPRKTGIDTEPLSLDDIAEAVPEESHASAQPATVFRTPAMPLPSPVPRQQSQFVATLGHGFSSSWAGLNTVLDFLGKWFTVFYLTAVPIFIIAPWPLLAYRSDWARLLLGTGISLSLVVLSVSWIVCSLKIPSLWPGGWIGYLATFFGIGLVGGVSAMVWPPAIALTSIVSTLVWLGFVVGNWDQIQWKCGRWLADCLASIVCLSLIWGIGYIYPTSWIAAPPSGAWHTPVASGGGSYSDRTAQDNRWNTSNAEPADSGWTRPTDPPPANRNTPRPAPTVSRPERTNIFDNPQPVTPPAPTMTERPVPAATDPAPSPTPTAQPVVTPDPQRPVVTERPRPDAAPTPPAAGTIPGPTNERPLPGVEAPVVPSPKDPVTVAKPAPVPSPAPTPLPVKPAPVVDNTPTGQLSRLGADVKLNADADITSVDLRGANDVAGAATILAGFKRIPVLRLLPSQFSADAMMALKTIPSITRLDFSEVKLADTDLARVAGLSNVDELSLSGQPITSAGIRALSPMLNLKKLYLKGTKIDDAAGAHLAKITSLRYLDVADTRMTSEGVEQLKPLKNLVGLVLTHTDVSDAAQQNLKAAIPRLNIIPP